MKPRHAAALALVGIYLIVPYPEGPHYGNWNVVGRFATVESCVGAEMDLTAEGFRSSAMWIDRKVSMEAWQKQAAMCVELSDSRPAPKEIPPPWMASFGRKSSWQA
jgi:hypothetical protein